MIGEALEFASTANDRTGWSQIAASLESCVRDLVVSPAVRNQPVSVLNAAERERDQGIAAFIAQFST